MTREEFGEEFVEYFSRTKGAVIHEVSRYLERVSEAYYARIYEILISEVPPNRSPGVSDIKGICERLGAPVTYKSPMSAKKSYSVTCDCCGYEYRWMQGALPEQAVDHVFDFCPRCSFPYSETVTMTLYEQSGRAGAWKGAYERCKAHYFKEWQARQKQARSA